MSHSTDISIESHPIKGILLALLAYLFISLIGISEKSISSAVSLPVILFFQNFVCLLLILPSMYKGGVQGLRLHQPMTYMLRIASGLGCYATLFYIMRYIPISQALLYQYSASLWLPFLMLFWWKVRMPKNLWYGIIIGFIGIGLILKPDADFFGIVTCFGLLCGILQAISVLTVRKLSLTEPVSRILFYYFLVGAIVTLPGAIFAFQPLALLDFIFLISVGINTYLGQQFLTLALRYAQATTLAPMCYCCILISGIFDLIFWNEIPEVLSLVGMALVILGCLLSIVFTKRQIKKPLKVVLS